MRLKISFSLALLLFVLIWQSLMTAQERRKWEEPQNLSILNSLGDDFAPSYSYQERALYFSSTQSGYAEFQISRYEARRDAASGEVRPRFSPPERVTTTLNQPRNNQSYISFAKDGSALISTFRMTKRRPYLNIFQVAQGTTLFSKPDAVDVLNTDGFNAHPALSPSGKTVVFASNRSSGRGGIDLWTANRDESGTWQVPVNMGDVLNSDGDEITPHFASEDSLYFSSNGFGGKGGFEIFLSVRLEGKWQPPVPIVELNSEYDDSDFAMLPGNVGVFASNRTGSRGGLDLYVARFVPISQLVSAIEYKIAAQTSFVTAEEFAMTDVIPLPPCLVFEPNIGTLPGNIRQYNTDEDTRSFSSQNLRPDPLTIYAELLNIIGKRLSDYADATLTLGATEGSNNALARQRIEAIRAYLQTVWNIDGKRIFAKNSTGEISETKRRLMMYAGEDAVRCVEIFSQDPRIIAPVRIAGVNVIAKPKKLDLALDVRPRTLLRSWNFALTAENASSSKDTIFRTAGVNLPFAGTVPIEPGAWAAVPEELHAHLTGVDSLGRKGRRELILTVYRLPLEQKRAQRVQDKIIDRYRFFVPTSDNAALATDQQAALRDIVSLLTGAAAPGSTLTLTPYSFGEKVATLQVERFAKSILDDIKRQAPLFPAQSLQIEPTTELTTPETPQERILARSVLLTIERPVPQSSQEKRGR